MKIVEKKNNLVLFKDLECGNVFKDPATDRYYIKIESIDEWVSELESQPVDAVALDDGSIEHYTFDAEVEKVECELIVK